MIISSTFVTACSLFGFKSLASFLYLISIPVLQTLSASDSVAENIMLFNNFFIDLSRSVDYVTDMSLHICTGPASCLSGVLIHLS